MPADDPRDERSANRIEPRRARDLFNRDFTFDVAAFEMASDVAEGDVVRGVHGERTAHLVAFNRVRAFDRDVAAHRFANGDGTDPARVEISADSVDDERSREIRDFEIAGEFLDLDRDARR